MAIGESRSAKAALRVLGWLRDGWLIFGLALLLLLGLEVAYRAKHALADRTAGVSADSTALLGHPYAKEPWWPEWQHDQHSHDYSYAHRFDPYRGYWGKPFQSTFLNVDSAGLRRTVQPQPGAGARRVLMLGGSTMWGYTARDAYTIPSLLAAELRACGIGDVEVVNLAQSGFNLTQNVITLLLELRRGAIPTVAVFLDGHNDIAAAGWFHESGHALWEAQLAARVEEGHNLKDDLGRLADRLLVVGRMQRILAKKLGRPEEAPAPPPFDGACNDVGLQYRNLTGTVRRLAEDYGFEAVFLWQPMLATTRKSLTPFELKVKDEPYKPARGWPPYREMLRRCSAIVEAMMTEERGKMFFPLDSLFDRDTSTVFLDDYGHLTEAGDARVAAVLADILAPKLATSKPLE